MADEHLPLPNTISECHALIRQLQAALQLQAEAIESLKRDNQLLKRALFGRRGERYEAPEQQYLFPTHQLGDTQTEQREEPLDSEDAEPEKQPRRGRVRRVIPECLPRVQRVQKLSEADLPEHLRGKEARRFLKKVGEWVEWIPPKLQVVEEMVETLAVDNEDATSTELISAPREPRILSCLAGPSLLAGLAVSRFADHQPYYRLEEALTRSGLTFDRATQCRWMIRLAEAVLPLVSLMRKLALQSPVVQADETPIKMLVPGQGHTSTVYLWAVLGDSHRPYTTFYFTEDRSRAGPEQFFSDFAGTLVADAYIAYQSLSAQSQGRIRLAGCHVHARRNFEKLHVLGPTLGTSAAMAYFQRLFDLEDELLPLSDEDRHRARQQRAAPLMTEFKAWLDQQLQILRPKQELRGAVTYMTTRWECFVRFLESGAIAVHNNAAEQAVKNPVIGKKNWLFFGSARGGHAAAILYTLTATCRRLKIDPWAYLSDVFEQLPRCDVTDPESLMPLLPDRWILAHPQSRLQIRQDESQDKAAQKRTLRANRRKLLVRQRKTR